MKVHAYRPDAPATEYFWFLVDRGGSLNRLIATRSLPGMVNQEGATSDEETLHSAATPPGDDIAPEIPDNHLEAVTAATAAETAARTAELLEDLAKLDQNQTTQLHTDQQDDGRRTPDEMYVP